MRIHSGMPGGVTLSHFLPPSRVTCTWPSSDPVQITPLPAGDSMMVKIVQSYSTLVLSCVIGPPEVPILDLSLRVRSGLMTSQFCPSLVVFMSTLEPMYSVFGSCGENTIGKLHCCLLYTSDAA